MNTNSSSPKILWAVDAFHEKSKDQLRVSTAVSHLFAGQDYIVEPVSVLAIGRYNPVEKVFMESWDELAQAAIANVSKLTRATQLIEGTSHEIFRYSSKREPVPHTTIFTFLFFASNIFAA